MTLNELGFYLVILAANIIQGITGFAGTILAMPFALQLVGYDIAKPVLNVLGLIAGIYIVALGPKNVHLKLLGRLSLYMGAGILCGMYIKQATYGHEKALYLFLGCFVEFVAIRGIMQMIRPQQKPENPEVSSSFLREISDRLLLLFAGTIHGMFICGGPLIISYVTRNTGNKDQFRRTISAVWIFLNGMIFAGDLSAGMFTPPVIRSQLLSIPFFFGGMSIGELLFKRMNQKVFMVLTYLLLIIAGISLFLK